MSMRRWALFLLPPVLAFAVVVSVRETSRAERRIVTDEAKAARVVTYVVEKGHPIRIPYDANTDVLRVVAHAFSRGALSPKPHAGQLSATLRGAGRDRTETLDFAAPGRSTRAASEDGDIVVGDPVAVNVDVHDAGVGDLILTLISLEAADGLLIRAYRRESIGILEAFRRRAGLGEARSEHLARRAGEPDWLDLDSDTQATLVTARWRKVAPVVDADRGIASTPLALAPRPPANPEEGLLFTDVDLRPDERVSGVVRGPAAMSARGDPALALTVSVHDPSGLASVFGGAGTVRFEAAMGQTLSFEVVTNSPQRVALYASDPDRVSIGGTVAYFLATAGRPAVITAGDDPLVIRVVARRPVGRLVSEDVAISVLASIETPSHATITSTFRATVGRSTYDRYEPTSPQYAPSERAAFHLLVPAGGRATLRPPEGSSVDLSFSELDPRAAARRAAARGAGRGFSDDVSRAEFAFRRPTNADDFSDGGEGLLRIGPRAPVGAAPRLKVALARIVRPRVAGTMRRDGKLFEPADVRFTVQVRAEGPLLVPTRLYAKDRVDVVVLIDGGHPRRRGGIAQRVSTDRSISVEGEVTTSILFGDDLEPGPHELRFVAAPTAALWVHLPWVRQGGVVRESSWVSGDFAQ